MARRPAKKKNERSLVPVLFTLGIIGWGFFAIDRLTKPDDELALESRSYGQRSEKSSPGWGSSMKKWLHDVLVGEEQASQDQKRIQQTHRNIESGNETPVRPDEDLPVYDDPYVVPAHEAVGPATESLVRTYYYRITPQGEAALTVVKQPGRADNPYRAAIEAVISGPPADQPELVDTFTERPRLNSVDVQGNRLVLDFSPDFGHGSSYRIIQYKISQLLHTAEQFSGIEAIQLKINGKYIDHLGGDGLSIPTVINRTTWPAADR